MEADCDVRSNLSFSRMISFTNSLYHTFLSASEAVVCTELFHRSTTPISERRWQGGELSLWGQTWLDLSKITVWFLAESSLRFLGTDAIRRTRCWTRTEGLFRNSDSPDHITPFRQDRLRSGQAVKGPYCPRPFAAHSEQMNQLNCPTDCLGFIVLVGRIQYDLCIVWFMESNWSKHY